MNKGVNDQKSKFKMTSVVQETILMEYDTLILSSNTSFVGKNIKSFFSAYQQT